MYKGEREILGLLAKKKRLDSDSIAEETGLNPDTVRRGVESLRGAGFVDVKREEYFISSVTKELEDYVKKGFPEFSVYKKAGEGRGIPDLNETERKIGLVWAKKKGFINIEKGKLVQMKKPADVEKEKEKMLETYKQVKTTGKTENEVMLDQFFQRHLVQRKTAKMAIVEYTGKPVEEIKEKFDVNIEGKDAPLGKKHPLTKMSNRIKEIMSELGFEEMEGSVVESSFWNFDALFCPQDHPARELADTFYLEGKSKLPEDKKLVERVKEAHEKGWKYRWSGEEAEKTVLGLSSEDHEQHEAAKFEKEYKLKNNKK